MGNPRSESKTTALRSHCGQRDGWLCFRCGQPIDPSLRYPHRMSATLEHVLPDGVTLAMWVAMGNDPYDPRYATISHRTCNSSAGTTMRNLMRKTGPRVNRLNTSRTW